MSWFTANDWIAAMNADGGVGYLGFDDWRLPTTQIPDSTCTDSLGNPRIDSFGWDCTGSEMGHLYYDEFGAKRLDGLQLTGDPIELAKFSNLSEGVYWSGTAARFIGNGISFIFSSGSQFFNGKSNRFFTWAVRDGDVDPPPPLPPPAPLVPEPATLVLLSLGLAGLGFLGWKRKNGKLESVR